MSGLAVSPPTAHAGHWLEQLPRIGDREVPAGHLLEWGGKFLLYRPAAGVVELWPQRPRLQIGSTRFPGFDPAPLSLTLAVHRQCGLACSYCYGTPEARPTPASLSHTVTAEAAAVVARSCRAAKAPLQVNFHGDHEPLLHPERLQPHIEIVRKAANASGVDLRLACTTSGSVPERHVIWAASVFDSMTLSHDGPPPLHDMQRPTRGGAPSGQLVERTLTIFSSLRRRGELTLRSTITRHNQNHQSEMVRFFLDRFAVDRLAFYPVYPSAHWGGDRGLAVDPKTFVSGFLQARRQAHARGIPLEYAGSRAPQRHGRHCTLLQRNLMLTPDGDATLCFMALSSRSHWERQRLFGHLNSTGDDASVTHGRVVPLLQRLGRMTAHCRGCFNLWHCEQGCPGNCPLEPAAANPPDCRIPFWIGMADILESAGLDPTEDGFSQLFALHPPASPAGSEQRA